MSDFTQEQVDNLIAERVAEARKGLFTEDDLTKKVTAEVDRRVESGIQKGLETQKQKWEREYSERMKLSAEELARKDFEEQMKTVSAKEKEINLRANKVNAKDLLSEASIPKSHYDKFIDILISDDESTTRANVENFIHMFNSTKTEIETQVKSEFTKIKPPSTGSGDKVVNKEDFNKMSYSEKMAFKTTNPTQFVEFMK